MAEEEQASETNNEAAEQQFIIQKIYCKDVSFETPNSPEMFTLKWEPELKVDLHTAVNPLGPDVFEVVLTVTVTVKVGDKTAFLAEVEQAGIFNVSGFEKTQLDAMLGSYCPNLLFPYVREVISELVNKGGFPQLILQPVNFEAVYAQHLQQRQEEGDAPATDAVH
ncbi:protein-export chaperone SecB [sulfur-oxidizing endosymbiont of Gigantopelta aegis]|uniref:protein-export chaperone SecB n=1 Tax=sulfur-oxidizing endosymbiont of Gigantopelta aegis TaxID=2794934 RepID=UPI0018DC21BE|nr:protein-export chaperone SecB [sulfur-oxidizing endosymbiont of Gigantopelta aegis]